jgi:hypothetical protein
MRHCSSQTSCHERAARMTRLCTAKTAQSLPLRSSGTGSARRQKPTSACRWATGGHSTTLVVRIATFNGSFRTSNSGVLKLPEDSQTKDNNVTIHGFVFRLSAVRLLVRPLMCMDAVSFSSEFSSKTCAERGSSSPCHPHRYACICVGKHACALRCTADMCACVMYVYTRFCAFVFSVLHLFVCVDAHVFCSTACTCECTNAFACVWVMAYHTLVCECVCERESEWERETQTRLCGLWHTIRPCVSVCERERERDHVLCSTYGLDIIFAQTPMPEGWFVPPYAYFLRVCTRLERTVCMYVHLYACESYACMYISMHGICECVYVRAWVPLLSCSNMNTRSIF